MAEKTKPKQPDVYLATQDQLEIKMAEYKAETKDWIDRVIDRQNEMHRQYLDLIRRDSQENAERVSNQTRWLIGLLTALIVAVLVRPYLGS